MVCTFAEVQFTGCGHSRILKTGCTKGCNGFCESSKSESILVTQFQYSCSTCTTADCSRGNQHFLRRYLREMIRVEDRVQDLEGEAKKMLRDDLQELVRKRCRKMAYFRQERDAQRVFDSKEAEYWTAEYAETIFQLKYGDAEGWEELKQTLYEMDDAQPTDLEVVSECGWGMEYYDPQESQESREGSVANGDEEAISPEATMESMPVAGYIPVAANTADTARKWLSMAPWLYEPFNHGMAGKEDQSKGQQKFWPPSPPLAKI